MPCGRLLIFTDGYKEPYLTYRGRNEINNSKNKYIGVCDIPNKPPTNEEMKEYKNNLFIYYTFSGGKTEFKILKKFEKFDNNTYKFQGDTKSYESNDIYTVEKPVEKPKANNNQSAGSKKKYKNKKKIIKNKKYLSKSSKYIKN